MPRGGAQGSHSLEHAQCGQSEDLTAGGLLSPLQAVSLLRFISTVKHQFHNITSFPFPTEYPYHCSFSTIHFAFITLPLTRLMEGVWQTVTNPVPLSEQLLWLSRLSLPGSTRVATLVTPTHGSVTGKRTCARHVLGAVFRFTYG